MPNGQSSLKHVEEAAASLFAAAGTVLTLGNIHEVLSICVTICALVWWIRLLCFKKRSPKPPEPDNE